MQKNSRLLKRVSVLFTGLLILLIITNPTPKDFETYIIGKGCFEESLRSGRTYNFFIASCYEYGCVKEIDNKGYGFRRSGWCIGVAKNFISFE